LATRLSFKGSFRFSDEELLEAGMDALALSDHALIDAGSLQRDGLGVEIELDASAPTRFYYATLFALEELAQHAKSGAVTATYDGVGIETQTIHALGSTGVPMKRKPSARTLLEAVRDGREELLEGLLALGGDPNIVDPNDVDKTLLHLAAQQGSERMVDALLRSGARVKRDAHGGLPLHEAQSATVVRRLLQAGIEPDVLDPFGRTPLERVAFMGYSGAARALVENGADLMCNGGVRLLAAAAEGGMVWLVERLLDEGADINGRTADGWTPLGVAATWGRADIARLLIDRGAEREREPQPGFTLLHLLAQHRSMMDLVNDLLDTAVLTHD